MVDHGSLAPMGVFVEAFARVRRRDHHRRGARADGHGEAAAHRGADGPAPGRRRLARASTGATPTEADIDAVYEVFVPMNVAVAAHYADVIPGAAEAVAGLARARAEDRLDHRLHARDHGRGDCRSPPPRAMRPTASSAPATRPTGDRRRSCCTGRSSTSASGRPGPASRSTTPRSASPRVATPAAGRWAWRSPATCSACRSPTRRRWHQTLSRRGARRPWPGWKRPARTT